MAEAYYNHLTNSRDAMSAGVLSHTPAMYGGPAAYAIDAMRDDGIDISCQRVKPVTQEMVDEAAEIVLLCSSEEVPSFVNDGNVVGSWEIPDPFGAALDGFIAVRDQIRTNVERLIRSRSE